MIWTDERVFTLKKLCADGLSASQIAKQLGRTTRNAVIGKINRLGLRLGGGVASEPRMRTPKPVHRPAARVVRLVTPPLAPEPAPVRTGTLATLSERGDGCAYPVAGEGADTLYCAGETNGAQYCALCRPLMYVAPPTAREKRDRMRNYLRIAAR